MSVSARDIPGTILWVAPFYNRTGYGVGARAMALALHRAGLRIRIMPVNEVEPGIDDCDMELLKSLEKTPPVPPITLLIFHVPDPGWLKFKLPEPSVRILATTFDGIGQGAELRPDFVAVCRQMDQVWVHTGKEVEALSQAGLAQEQIAIVRWPHIWRDNPVVPPPVPEPDLNNQNFRFFSVAIFQPRIRWNVLIEAFLHEFRKDEAELYLKVRFPEWHPIPQRPREEFQDLLSRLRRVTGSQTTVLIDEQVGTRMELLKLFDRCNAYISTDINNTAPISEALVRERLIISAGGIYPGELTIQQDCSKRIPVEGEMLLYKPGYRTLPVLRVEDVRVGMRKAYSMSPEERRSRGRYGAAKVPDAEAVVPCALQALKRVWERKL